MNNTLKHIALQGLYKIIERACFAAGMNGEQLLGNVLTLADRLRAYDHEQMEELMQLRSMEAAGHDGEGVRTEVSINTLFHIRLYTLFHHTLFYNFNFHKCKPYTR